MLLTRLCSFIERNIQKYYYINKYKDNLSMGKNVYWRRGFHIIIGKDAKLRIEEGCLFNYNCSITCLGKIRIGDHTIIGEGVKMYDHNHVFNKRGINITDQGKKVSDISIGRNCWIGSNVVILSGTKIGNNCVIGAGSIVNGKIQDNSLLRPKVNYKIEKISFKN